MNLGQMMLTVLATFLLTTVILSSNRSLLTNTETIVRAKQELMSISLAASLMERASRLDFDTATISNTPSATTKLGPIGRESTDSWSDSLFNDVDDYNNFRDTIYIGASDHAAIPVGKDSMDVYYLRANVYYVNEADPFGTPLAGTSSTRSWVKRIEVRVWTPAAKTSLDTFYFCQLHGYWKWR